MIATFERDAALRQIGRVADSVPRRNTIDILRNMLIEPAPGALRLVGNNLDLQAEALIPASGELSAITVPAEMFGRIVGNLPAGALVGLQEGNDGRLSIRAGRSAYKLPTLSAADYPKFRDSDVGELAELPAAALMRLLDSTLPFVATEANRQYLHGVHLVVVGSKLRAVATDTGYVGLADMKAPGGLSEGPGITIPTDAAKAVRRALVGAETASIGWTKSLVVVEAASVRITAKLLDYPFVPYMRIVPQSPNTVFTADAEELTRAVSRALPFPDDNEIAVTLKIDAEGGRLLARSDHGAEADEAFDLEYEGESRSVSFSGRRLTKVLAQIEGERARFSYEYRNGDPFAAVLVEDPSDAARLFLLGTLRGGIA